MDARVRAGIDLYGTSLRYAEVERYGTQHRLLRLGNCDFDFDVTRALWGGEAGKAQEVDQQIKTLSNALADVYESTSAEVLRVVVHPPRAHSFFAPIPAQTEEAERLKRFRREAQLLARSGAQPVQEGAPAPGVASPPGDEALHLRANGLYAEEDQGNRREWFHVLALDGGVHARFRQIMEALPLPDFRWTISMEAAAQAAIVLEHHRREQAEPDRSAAHVATSGQGTASAKGRAPGKGTDARDSSEAPFTLIVGRYPGHLELALARYGRFHYALYAPRARPADSAYYTAALLDQLGIAPAAVGRIFVYGFRSEASQGFAVLDRLTGVTPEPLDFRPIVGLNADRLAEDFEAGTYVPCVGAAL